MCLGYHMLAACVWTHKIVAENKPSLCSHKCGNQDIKRQPSSLLRRANFDCFPHTFDARSTSSTITVSPTHANLKTATRLISCHGSASVLLHKFYEFR